MTIGALTGACGFSAQERGGEQETHRAVSTPPLCSR